jgi:hypothetical protein
MPGGDRFSGERPRTCEEFAVACLDFRSMPEGNPVRTEMLNHLRACPQCAALQANWQMLQDDLRCWGEATSQSETPSRVQMRLMQEFRTKHTTMKTRRIALIGSWSLTAAALLVMAVSWTTRRLESNLQAHHGDSETPRNITSESNKGNARPQAGGLEIGDTLIASSSSGEFTLLPGSTPSPMEDATVVRVQMQRGALGALGFTVNEEHAADLIQVDLLVGDDGLPQAVRLRESTE